MAQPERAHLPGVVYSMNVGRHLFTLRCLCLSWEEALQTAQILKNHGLKAREAGDMWMTDKNMAERPIDVGH